MAVGARSTEFRNEARKEAPREAKTAVRTGAKRKRLVSDNSQFINLIGVYANHRWTVSSEAESGGALRIRYE